MLPSDVSDVKILYGYRQISVHSTLSDHQLDQLVSVGSDTATAADGEIFILLFLIYPFVTNRLFSVLNCRRLSVELWVLVDDYAVSCSTSTHIVVQVCSVVAIVVFSFGAPLGLLVHLRRSRRASAKEFDTPEWKVVQHRAMLKLQPSVAHKVLELHHETREDVVNCIIDISNGTRYGNLVSPYRPDFFCECLPPVFHWWWASRHARTAEGGAARHNSDQLRCCCFAGWEPIDLLRKLLLVGLLSVVDRGSVAQVWVGIVLSFCFFALHVKTLPFRHWEDNLLKMMIEAHVSNKLLSRCLIHHVSGVCHQKAVSIYSFALFFYGVRT